MKPFFSDEARVRQLQAEARTWLGTPFHAHGKFKRVGVDCVWLAAEIYRVLGVAPPDAFPEYSIGAGSHLEASKVAMTVESCRTFMEISPAAPEHARCGDLLGFQLGRVIHHVGVALDGARFIHSVASIGVCENNLRDPSWSRRLRAIWRPVEPDAEKEYIFGL